MTNGQGQEVGERLFTFTKNIFPIIHEDHSCRLNDLASSCSACIIVLNKLDKSCFSPNFSDVLKFVHNGNLNIICFQRLSPPHCIILYN